MEGRTRLRGNGNVRAQEERKQGVECGEGRTQPRNKAAGIDAAIGNVWVQESKKTYMYASSDVKQTRKEG